MLEGVLESEAVKRVLLSPKQRRSLKMRMDTASCPGNGQVRPSICTFRHAFILDRHTRKTCANSAASACKCLVGCPG